MQSELGVDGSGFLGACGLGPDFGAQPFYLQKLAIPAEAPGVRMGDHDDALSTVSFDPLYPNLANP
jgi:hypothetical protein